MLNELNGTAGVRLLISTYLNHQAGKDRSPITLGGWNIPQCSMLLGTRRFCDDSLFSALLLSPPVSKSDHVSFLETIGLMNRREGQCWCSPSIRAALPATVYSTRERVWRICSAIELLLAGIICRPAPFVSVARSSVLDSQPFLRYTSHRQYTVEGRLVKSKRWLTLMPRISNTCPNSTFIPGSQSFSQF